MNFQKENRTRLISRAVNGGFMLLIFAVIATSCSNEPTEEELKDRNLIGYTKEASEQFNKELLLEEQIGIQVYLKRRPEWNMIATGTGLQYYIYSDSLGENAKRNQNVHVNFEVKLLDGSIAYASEEGEPHTFKVDNSNVESGIQEAVKHLSVGDKAHLIIPSHLGHGLVGDFNKIPPLQVLIVDIEVVGIQ